MEDTKYEHYESSSTKVVYLKFKGIICNSPGKENDPKWNDPFNPEKGW